MRVGTAISALVLAAAGLVHAGDPVHFRDPALKAAVEETLGILDPTPTDMLGLTHLIANGQFTGGMGIADLTGLQFAVNLETLSLFNNQIRDTTPLAGLTRLTTLNLHENNLTDLSPLAGLIHLQHLDLHHNYLDDLSPLAGLKDLRRLYLRENRISDLSALAGLTGLQELTLNDDRVSDLSPLAGLVDLQILSLFDNPVSDLAPLLSLKKMATLDVRADPLNETAFCSTLWEILDNNPGVTLMYTPNAAPCAGVSASDGTAADRVKISWKPVCNGPLYTTYYRVYRGVPGSDARTPVSPWQTEVGFDDLTATAGTMCTYWVQTSTPSREGEGGAFSAPDAGWLAFGLTVSCTTGGRILAPQPGASTYVWRQTVEVKAEPADSNLYRFSCWKGTAVEAGKVADACSAETTVTVDGNYGVTACFVSRLDTLHVDDDAPGDPEPGDPGVGDPRENGTMDHPLDSIQEAIEVAADGASVVVESGTYRETLDLLGKRIRVTRRESMAEYPAIDAGGQGPAVRFARGEPRECVLEGLLITGARGAAAVSCTDSSPTLAYCLIVGNRSTGRDGAAVYCENSRALLLHCTIADNPGGGLFLSHSPVTLTECIVWANDPAEIWLQDAEAPVITYSDIAGTWAGVGNLHCDPLFSRRGVWTDPQDPLRVLPASDARAVWVEGDYHLQSQAGRWDPRRQAWVRDQVTSLCIDSGDPSSPPGQEPAPNGGRGDLGAYGGTAQASQSFAVESPVVFGDALLKAAVEETLGVFDPTPTDMLGLTHLTADGQFTGDTGIADLTGLQFAVNLETLSLFNNQIRDTTPLAGLTRLTTLNLHENNVTDLSPLAGLIHLQHLDLHHNYLDDLSPLAGLKDLRRLYLRENRISDLAPLAGLMDLQELTLNNNRVSELAGLVGLADLRILSLFDNPVSDLAPLLSLKKMATLDVRADPLNETAFCSDLWEILDNNPGVTLMYTPSAAPCAGVSASDGTAADRVKISWKPVCNGPLYTTYYRVYRGVPGSDAKTPISPWQTEAGFDDLTATAGTICTYWVQTSTPSHGLDAGDFSLPDTGYR